MSRQAVVDAAVAELGKGNQAEYWSEALGYKSPAVKKAWCGIFSLYCLHKAGIALKTHWVFGLGFLSTPERKAFLNKTSSPKPGDIGYRDQPFQHHFIVESVDGDMVHSIDGNSGSYSTVNRCTHPIGHGCDYYSIGPLVGEVELPSPSKPPPAPGGTPRPSDIQHHVNNLIMLHLEDSPPQLLTIDGILGPKSHAAIQWAQRILGLPPTGVADAETCRKLGL